jgi:uncharacterized damage-inducible protein DinB
MDPVLTMCLNMMGTNEHLLGKALEGLSAEDAWRQPGDANPIHWLAGHMTIYRYTLLSVLGAGSEVPWAGPFKRTMQPDPAAQVPPVEEIAGAMKAAGPKLAARYAELTDAELAADAPFKLPTPDPSLRGMLAFFAYHESYHLGQVALVRKWIGGPGIVDGQ